MEGGRGGERGARGKGVREKEEEMLQVATIVILLHWTADLHTNGSFDWGNQLTGIVRLCYLKQLAEEWTKLMQRTISEPHLVEQGSRKHKLNL